MIDTDKYEGHSPQHKWMLRGSGEPELCRFADGDVMLSSYWLSCPATKANEKLIEDAPLLLAEVKRLRVLLDVIVDITLKELKIFDDNCPMINIRDLAYKGILWEE